MKEKHMFNKSDVKYFDTDELRDAYLVNELFELNRIKTVYSYSDRMIIGGAYPRKPLSLNDEKTGNQSFFLEKREIGIINIGGVGCVTVNGDEYNLEPMDGLYIGKGDHAVEFKSVDSDALAKFYFISTLADTSFPTTLVKRKEAIKLELGSTKEANERLLYKYIHPEGVKSCHLVMGFTQLLEGSVWNSLPPHIHERRSEVYFYFNIPQSDIVFHFMGSEDQTRHLVVKNEEAVISPYWSLHSGVGTKNYSFVWAMSGENQDFADARTFELINLK